MLFLIFTNFVAKKCLLLFWCKISAISDIEIYSNYILLTEVYNYVVKFMFCFFFSIYV